MRNIFIFFSVVIGFFTPLQLNACSTIKLEGGNHVVVGRNFDWPSKYTFLMVNPIGTAHAQKTFVPGGTPAHWISKYGNVTFDFASENLRPIDQAVYGGINQFGLVASMLWLSASEFPNPAHKTELNSGRWVQYVLDNAKTVSDAIELMKNITVEPTDFNNRKIKLHLMVTDAQGKSAVFEYLHRKLVVHSGKNLPIAALTNIPYADSLSLLSKFKNFGGNQALLAGSTPEARFALAANFLKLLPKTDSLSQLIAYTFDGLGYLIQLPGTKNPTQWSVVYDLKNKIIYYRDIDNANIRYLKLSDLDFSNKGGRYKPFLINNQLAGDILSHFEKSSS